MRLFHTTAACLLLPTLAACAHTRQPSAGAEAQPGFGIAIEGRFVTEPAACADVLAGAPACGPTLRLAYSLSALRARFTGTDVDVVMEDLGRTVESVGGNRFAVDIDGVPQPPLTLLPGPPRTYALARGLAGGPSAAHTLRLTKLTEAVVGEVRLFKLAPSGQLLPPPPGRSRRIWLLGDSITCGYGNLGVGPHCPFSAATEDAMAGYGGQLGRRLHAQLEVVAYSGRGVWQNLDGTHTATVPQLFAQRLPSTPELAANFSAPAPQAIVVNLGTNDASAAAQIDDAALAEAYTQLLHSLRAHAPRAHIFVATGPMLSNASRRHPNGHDRVVQAIFAAMDAVGGRGCETLHLVGLPQQTGALGYGCDYHPSLQTHLQMADRLTQAIGETLHWTSGP